MSSPVFPNAERIAHCENNCYHIQFNDGPRVIVKNTFLDCDDIPKPQCVDRGVSAPARMRSLDSSSSFFGEMFPMPRAHRSCREPTPRGSIEDLCTLLVDFDEYGFSREELLPPPLAPLKAEDDLDVTNLDVCSLNLSGLSSAPHSWTSLAAELSKASSSTTPTSSSSTATPSLSARSSTSSAAAVSSTCSPSRIPHVADGASEVNDVFPQASGIDRSRTIFNFAGALQPQTLVRSEARPGVTHHSWIVDAKKLHGSARSAVSPTLLVGSDNPVPFKLILIAKSGKAAQPAHSFKKSKGIGHIQLKCEHDMKGLFGYSLNFRVAIGSGYRENAKWGSMCDLILHDFARTGVCSLSDEFDFGKIVDKVSQTFVVCLEVSTPI